MKYARKLLSLLIGLGLWEATALVARTRSFPHSWSVLSDLFILVTTAPFWSSLAFTLWLSFLGLLFGTFLALSAGLLIGVSSAGESATRGVLNFVRCIPAVVMLPLLISSIGSSATTAVVLTIIVVSFKLVLFVIRGVRDTDPQLLESTNAMGMPIAPKILLVYLPSTISMVGTGLRLSASRAFGTIIAAGIVSGTPGLGSKMYLAESAADYDRAFAYVVVMGLVGMGVYEIFSAVERKFFTWRVTV